MDSGKNGFSSGKNKDEFLDGADAIPKVSYDIIKEKKLREILEGFGLPSTGDKNVLIERHKK